MLDSTTRKGQDVNHYIARHLGNGGVDQFENLEQLVAPEGRVVRLGDPQPEDSMLRLSHLIAVGEMTARIAKAQRGLLRIGIIPSHATARIGIQRLAVSDVAMEYARLSIPLGNPLITSLFQEFASDMPHKYLVRSVFPEIENLARNHVYDPDVTYEITSLPNLRIAVGFLLAHSPFAKYLEFLQQDFFLFVLLDSLDYSYLDDRNRQKSPVAKYERLFKYVPNRHHALHGLSSDYEQAHAINALTLLYVSSLVCCHLNRLGIRLPAQYKDSGKYVREYHQTRRRISSLLGKFIMPSFRSAVADEKPSGLS